jgi:hypothetical protein
MAITGKIEKLTRGESMWIVDPAERIPLYKNKKKNDYTTMTQVCDVQHVDTPRNKTCKTARY